MQVCFCPKVPIQPCRPKSDSASPGTIVEHNLSQSSPIKSLMIPVHAGIPFSPWVQISPRTVLAKLDQKNSTVFYSPKGPRLHNKSAFLSCTQALFLWVNSELYFFINSVELVGPLKFSFICWFYYELFAWVFWHNDNFCLFSFSIKYDFLIALSFKHKALKFTTRNS